MKPLAHPPLRLAIGCAAPLLLLFWWQAQSGMGGARAPAFVPLQDVAANIAEELRSGLLISDAVATLSRAVTGLVLGSVAGILLGTAMATWSLVDRLIGPLYHAVRQVPLLGWLPLIGLWFGNGDAAKLLIVSLAAFYPTVLASYEGLRQVERRYIEVGALLGLETGQRFFHILLPGALPLILTGISQALAFAWIGTIGTEILLGSGAGLGATMSLAQAQQRMDTIIVAILATGLLGFSLNQLFSRFRQHLLRWQPVIA